LREYGDKLTQEERLEIERALNEAREKLKSDDINEIRRAKDNLLRASYKLGEAVYKGTGQTQTATGPTAGQQTEETKKEGKEVIDAEYKEEK